MTTLVKDDLAKKMAKLFLYASYSWYLHTRYPEYTPGSFFFKKILATVSRIEGFMKKGSKPPQVRRKLPDFDVMVRLIEVEGLTHKEIADKYNVRECNVRGTLRRRANALNRPYPVRNKQVVRQQVTKRRNETMYCNPIVLRGLVQEAEKIISRASLAKRSGVGVRTLYALVYSKRTRVSRQTAEKLEKTLTELGIEV